MCQSNWVDLVEPHPECKCWKTVGRITSIEQLNQLQPTQNLFEEQWKSTLLFKL